MRCARRTSSVPKSSHRWPPPTLERAARWTGKKGALVEALEAERFIDREGDVLVVHGVGDRLKKAIDLRAKAAARQQRKRDRDRDDPRDVTRDDLGSVTRDGGVNHAATRQDQTRPDRDPGQP